MPDEGGQGDGSVVWSERGEGLGDDVRGITAESLYKLCKSLRILAFT